MKKLLTSLILAAAGLFATNSFADHRPTDDYFRFQSLNHLFPDKMPRVGFLISDSGSFVEARNWWRRHQETVYRNTNPSRVIWYYSPMDIQGRGQNFSSYYFSRNIITSTINVSVAMTLTTATTTAITTGTVTSTTANTITTTTHTPTISVITILEAERQDKSQTLRAELDTIAELEKISHKADLDLFDFGIGCFESRIGCTPDHYREALRGRDRVIFGTALEHLEECIVDAFGGGIIHATKQEVLNLALYVRGAIMYHRRQDVNGQMMIILKYRQSDFHRNTYEKVCDYLQTRDWNGRIPAGIRGADIVQNAHRTYERH